MTHSMLVFGFAMGMWMLIRGLTWPLPALFLRVFWVVVLALAAVTVMFATQLGTPVVDVCQQMAAGLAAGEIVLSGAHQRWQRFKQKQAQRSNGSGSKRPD